MGWNDAVVWDGTPPLRSGMTAASSATKMQSTTPIAVAPANNGMAAAPRAWMAGGSSPITRIGDASPMTNAPHQFVFRCKREPVSDIYHPPRPSTA
jgi:hypothetical protein